METELVFAQKVVGRKCGGWKSRCHDARICRFAQMLAFSDKYLVLVRKISHNSNTVRASFGGPQKYCMNGKSLLMSDSMQFNSCSLMRKLNSLEADYKVSMS